VERVGQGRFLDASVTYTGVGFDELNTLRIRLWAAKGLLLYMHRIHDPNMLMSKMNDK
jgi:hypothetical protein